MSYVRSDGFTPVPAFTWSLVIPVKRLSRAKTRLAAAAGPHRETLALSVAADTVAAALRCDLVRAVVVVTDDSRAARELNELGARVVPDVPDDGLNPALSYGAQVAREVAPEAPVGALSADLPALRPRELELALRAAEKSARSFVPDAAGTGTTLYTALPGVVFQPAFGPDSAARHRAQGADELAFEGIWSLRRDVDTLPDLRTALVLGTGPRTAATAALLPVGRLPSVQGTVRTYDATTRSGRVLLDDGSELEFDSAAFDAGGLRLLRFGQRVNLAVDGDRIGVITLATFPLPG